jgi:hypothetical protein
MRILPGSADSAGEEVKMSQQSHCYDVHVTNFFSFHTNKKQYAMVSDRSAEPGTHALPSLPFYRAFSDRGNLARAYSGHNISHVSLL